MSALASARVAPDRVAGIAARLRGTYAEGGLRALWFGALGTLVYRRLLVLERRLDVAATDPPPSTGPQVVVLDDAHAYRALRPDQPVEEFARRRAAGGLCFAAVLGDRVVGATWARQGGGWCAYLERTVFLRPDEVYLFDTMVDPSLRGCRIAPGIALAQIRAFRERGLSRIVATVLPENRASLRARARSGFVVCGRMGWIGVGRRRRHFVRGAVAREILSPR